MTLDYFLFLSELLFFIMQLHTWSRSKLTRIFMVVLVFVLLSVFLFVSDSFIGKIHSHKLPTSCILCPMKTNATYQNKAELLHFNIFLLKYVYRRPVDVLLFFVHASNNPRLKSKLNLCLSSLLNYATPALHLHILTDLASLNSTTEVLKNSAPLAKTAVQVSLYDVNVFMAPLEELINTLVPHFSFKPGAYYSDGLFYISIGLFKVMNLKQVIVIDADVKFLSDVKLLHDYFDRFPSEAIIGIAREQQPVYRHILHEYRRLYDTKLGDPPPDGVTGFNSGVLLLDLDKMRNSSTYLKIINNSSIISELVKRYKFRGHLGDQDFYTLVSFEYSHLFYTLPCTWNRQLCQWWKYHGYQNVFNLYYSCAGRAHILHGNCNSVIPDY